MSYPMLSDEREVKFCIENSNAGEEELDLYMTEFDAIEHYLIDMEPEHYPESINVLKYQEAEFPDDNVAEDLLEWLIMALDSGYELNCGPDPTVITDAMRKLAVDFVKGFRSTYPIWQYDRMNEDSSGTVINVKDWVDEHHPEWISDDEEEEDVENRCDDCNILLESNSASYCDRCSEEREAKEEDK
jgi:hypothetical protein